MSEEIDGRMAILKTMGAGEPECASCLSYGVHDLDICKQCIHDTQTFTTAMNALAMRNTRAAIAAAEGE